MKAVLAVMLFVVLHNPLPAYTMRHNKVFTVAVTVIGLTARTSYSKAFSCTSPKLSPVHSLIYRARNIMLISGAAVFP
jgi:hypothetical protein